MKLFVFGADVVLSNARIISSGGSSGSGDRPLSGESVPGGNGMFAAIVTSLSSS